MLRFLAAPAACLILCGTAAAQDMPGLATLSPPDLAQPRDGGRSGRPGMPRRAVRTMSARISAARRGHARRRTETPPGAPRPWCAQERRVGTGTGFCLIN